MKRRVTVPVQIRGLLPSSSELDTRTKNVTFAGNGTVATRYAIAPLFTDNMVEETLNFRYFEGDGFVMTPGVLYENGTLAKAFAKSDQTFADFTEANGKLFLAADFNTATEKMQVIEASTHIVRDTTAVVDENNFVLYPGLVENHKGVLFAARLTESDGFHATRIRWSDFADPENFSPWGAGNFQSFEDIGEPYDEILRIISFKDDLIIFKQKSVWVASGTQSDIVAPEYFRQLSATHHLVGPNAIARTPDGLLLLTTSGLFLFDGSRFIDVGKDIWQYISDRSTTYWAKAAVGFDPTRKHTFVAVPDTNNYNEDCFVRNEKEWTRYEYPLRPTCFDMNGDDFIIGMHENGLFHQVQSSLHDDTDSTTESAINGVWATDWLDLHYPNRDKLMRTIEVVISVQSAEPVTNVNMTVQNFYDYETTPRETNTLDMSARSVRGLYDGNRLTGIKWFSDIDGQCRKAKFVFSGTGLNVLFEIISVACSFIPKGSN